MKRFSAGVAVLALALGLAGATTAQASPPRTAETAVPARVTAYTPPPVAWHTCSDSYLASAGAQCGMLVVPMDYAQPRGTKIKLAVSRVRHTTSAARYQGVMLVNPGGPGGSGLSLSTLGAYVPNHAGDAYDWIGFDPRGVGSSVPSLSCNANFFHGDRPPYRPTNATIMKNWINRSKAYAAACARAPHSALFNHVKTTDTVNDMESLRKALGQEKINFYGFSYGTYLGQVYATLHPNRVRRFVFDGTVNPTRVWYRANQDQDVAFQKTFNSYFAWLAKYHSVYSVASTQVGVRRQFLATVAKLDRHAAGGVLGGDELIDVFTSAGYYVYGWEQIAAAYSTYLTKGDPSALIDLYTGANPTSPGGDNGYALYLGTQCTDAQWPRSQARLNQDNFRLDRNYDYMTWSNAWFNGPCAYWHFQASKPVQVSGARVHTPILMIGETFDAATPFSGSLVVRHLFPTASLIEGKNGTTHAGSLSGVSCTDNTIARYLENGSVPARVAGYRADKVCPPVPQPHPTAAATSAAKTRVDSAPAAVAVRVSRTHS